MRESKRGPAHHRLHCGAVLQVELEIVAGIEAQLREIGALERAVGAKMRGSARDHSAGVERDRADRVAIGPVFEREGGFPRLARRLHGVALRALDLDLGEIDIDVGGGFVERRLQVHGHRADRRRAAVKSEPRPRRIVERHHQIEHAVFVGGLGQLDLRRHGVEEALAGDLDVAGVGDDVERALLEALVADIFVEREIRERSLDAEFLIVGMSILAEAQVEPERALELPLDRRRIDREAGVALDRIAREQVGERVGPAGDMGAPDGGDDEGRTGIRHLEEYIRPLHAPALRELHDAVFCRDREHPPGQETDGI